MVEQELEEVAQDCQEGTGAINDSNPTSSTKRNRRKKKKASKECKDVQQIDSDGKDAQQIKLPKSSTGAADGKQQTFPEPTVPVRKLFPQGDFPEGEIMLHPIDGDIRMKSAEARLREKVHSSEYSDLRHAAEVHRQVRAWVNSWLCPGLKMIDI
eukprot:EG_transcript_40230